MRRILILFLILFPTLCLGANLIPNSSFEVGDYGWFNASDHEVHLLTDLVTTQAKTGLKSFKLTFGSPQHFIESWPFKLTPSTTYTFSFWAFREPTGWSGSHGIFLHLKSFNRAATDTPYDSAEGTSPYIALSDQVGWQLVQADITTPAVHEWYFLYLKANDTGCAGCNAYIDDIMIEPDTASPTWTPRTNLEVGITTAKSGNIFLLGDTIATTFKVRNDSGSSQSGTLRYEVYNHWNVRIINSAIVITNQATNSGSDNVVNLPINGTGHFRIYAWIDGLRDSETEANISIVPIPQNTATIDPDSMMGVHAPNTDFHLGLMKNIGAKWSRTTSPFTFGRWPIYEPTRGGYLAAADFTNFSTHKIIPMANTMFQLTGYLPTHAYWTGSDLTWQNANPDTITSADGGFSTKFANGDQILVQRFENAHLAYVNNGVFTINTLTDKIITLVGGDSLTADASAGEGFVIINYTAWKNYVTDLVSKNKANVDYWEVLNEVDLEGGLEPAVYAKLLEDTSTIIKAQDDTGGYVIAPNAAQSAWITSFYGATGLNDVDYISYHAYPTNEGTSKAVKDLYNTLVGGGGNLKNLWNTETGVFSAQSYYSTPFEKYRRPLSPYRYTQSEYFHDVNSAMLAINILGTMHDGGDSTTAISNKYFYYWITRTELGDTYSQYTLLNWDGTLKPPAVVYSVIAKLFDKYQAIGTTVDLPADVDGYAWQDKDGIAWIVIWTDDEDGTTTILKTITVGTAYAYYDIYGNQVSASTTSIPIGPNPIYIKSLTRTKTQMISDFDKDVATYASRTDTTAPNLSITATPRGQFVGGETVRFAFLGIDQDQINNGTDSSINRISYRWKLDGVDSNYTAWTTDKTKTVEYASVSAGNYTFRVQAKDESGNIMEKVIYNGLLTEASLTLEGGSSSISIGGGSSTISW